MQLKNTRDTYGSLSKAFHWLMAFIMLGLIVLGMYMAGLEPSPDKYALYPIHKSFGLLIFWLIGFRILWNFYTKRPEGLKTHQKWEKFLSKSVHWGLYVSMIGIPLSGWIMSSAGGHSVGFFGIDVPALVAENKELGKSAHGAHTILSYVLIGLVALHALGAFKHHFIDGDITLKRMMAEPMQKIGPYVLIVILGLFCGAVVKFLFLS